jgi:hypothetical protein
MKTYAGSCHCGAVTYDVHMEELTGAMRCNCSRCHRLGWLLAFVPASAFHLKSGEESLIEYRFNTKRIAHLFCKTCGIESFARGKGPDDSDTVALNVLCLEGVDPKTLVITEVNGKDI